MATPRKSIRIQNQGSVPRTVPPNAPRKSRMRTPSPPAKGTVPNAPRKSRMRSPEPSSVRSTPPPAPRKASRTSRQSPSPSPLKKRRIEVGEIDGVRFFVLASDPESVFFEIDDETEDEQDDESEEDEETEETEEELQCTVTSTVQESGDILTLLTHNGETYTLSDGHIQYANGDVYQGPVSAGLPAEHGSMLFKNGAIFHGRFKKGLPVEGRTVWPNGTEYNGKFQGGFEQGRGTFFYPNGTQLTTAWGYE